MTESSEDGNRRENNNDESSTNSGIRAFLSGLGSKLSGSGQWVAIILFWLVFVYLIVSAIVDPLPTLSFSDNQLVFVLSIVVAIPLTIAPTYLIVSKIYNPTKWAVAKIDASSESVLDAWFASPELVQNMTVEDGQPRQKTIRGVPTMLVNDFDPESNSCKAPREMELTDWEMWGEKEAIERQRHRNNVFIEFGKQLWVKLPNLGQQVESNYWRKMSRQQAESELNNPDVFLDAVEDELPDLDSDPVDEMRAVHNDITGSQAGDTDE